MSKMSRILEGFGAPAAQEISELQYQIERAQTTEDLEAIRKVIEGAITEHKGYLELVDAKIAAKKAEVPAAEVVEVVEEGCGSDVEKIEETLVAVDGDFVKVEGTKEKYKFKPAEGTAQEVVDKFNGLMRHSEGRAWQYLKAQRAKGVEELLEDEGVEGEKECPYKEKVDYLIKDEEEAIEGYEAAIKLFANYEAEGKEALIEKFKHIKDEEEEHIDELKLIKEILSGEASLDALKDEDESVENIEGEVKEACKVKEDGEVDETTDPTPEELEELKKAKEEKKFEYEVKDGVVHLYHEEKEVATFTSEDEAREVMGDSFDKYVLKEEEKAL